MKQLVGLLLLMCLGSLPQKGLAQLQSLPELRMHRRNDSRYMDSLTMLAKRQYRSLMNLPITPHRDTLCLQTLYYLGRLFRWRIGYRDSTFYYGTELVRRARARQNNIYEVAGKVLLEAYYHTDPAMTREAIRLNHEIYASLPEMTFLLFIRYRTLINLSDLHQSLQDNISAHRYLKNAMELASFLAEGIKKDALEEQVIPDGDSYLKPYIVTHFLLDINLKLAVLAAKMNKSAESEKNYLEAELLMNKHTSLLVKRFIYAEISDFYFTHQRYRQALDYAKKAEASKAQNQPQPEAYRLSLLACEFANRGQYDKADQYIENVLSSPTQPKQVYKETYMALFQIAQHRNEPKRMVAYMDLYRHQRDTLTVHKATEEFNFIEDQGVFNELILDREEQSSKLKGVTLSFFYTFIIMLIILLVLLIYSTRLSKRKTEASLQLAIERKEASARIIRTQEAERQRIAADLHDDLGGTLATMHRRFNDLYQTVRGLVSSPEFDDLAFLIQKSSTDLRRIAHNLMPPEFARIGMRNAVEELLASQPARPTHFRFVVSGSERSLPVEVELNAYRIICELIENINKHAEARQATVQLLYFDSYVSILVEDDGVGRSGHSTVLGQSGIGIKSSTLRADYIGATLRWEWNKGGTLVILEIPYATNTHG